MDLKRRNDEFAAEEMEVAEALLSLRQFGTVSFPQWSGKRRRSKIGGGGGANCTHKKTFVSKIGSPISPLNLIGFSGSEADEHCGEADLLHPVLPPLSSARRLSSPTQKSGHVVNPRRRAPKKKTHAELKEMVNALHVENKKLKKDKKQLLKTHQALQDWNKNLKSELGRRQGSPLVSVQGRLNDPDLGHKPKAATCFDEVPKLRGHGCSKIIADALSLDLTCKERCSNGMSMCHHSPECSYWSERDYSQSTKGVFPVGDEDLNVPGKALSGPLISGCCDYMLLSMEKDAVSDEARKQGIEHLKSKKNQPLQLQDQSRGYSKFDHKL